MIIHTPPLPGIVSFLPSASNHGQPLPSVHPLPSAWVIARGESWHRSDKITVYRRGLAAVGWCPPLLLACVRIGRGCWYIEAENMTTILPKERILKLQCFRQVELKQRTRIPFTPLPKHSHPTELVLLPSSIYSHEYTLPDKHYARDRLRVRPAMVEMGR